MKKQKVLVAMSGGVDSSVAALLMKKQGYEVLGVFLKCWSDTKNFRGECQWKEERRSAMKVCMELNIPLITLDAEKEYKKYVVEDMFRDYKRGITPNPDVLCNEIVKFPFLLQAVKKLEADYLVTGHYADLRKNKGKFELLRAKDEMKDQSYFLYRLKQEELKKILFPIGAYTKTQVRKIAQDEGFLNYNKKSTVGICFIGKIPMKEFLKSKIKTKKGNIVDPKGNIIGVHDGIAYYTIGQRLGPRNGLDIIKDEEDKSNISRWYVARKDVKKNILVAAPRGHESLYRKEIIITSFHLITKNKKEFLKKISHKPMSIYSRIRHVGELLPSKLSYNKKKKRITLLLNKKINGISEGQAVVLYSKRIVLGGGEIAYS